MNKYKMKIKGPGGCHISAEEAEMISQEETKYRNQEKEQLTTGEEKCLTLLKSVL